MGTTKQIAECDPSQYPLGRAKLPSGPDAHLKFRSVDNRQHFSLWYFVLVVLFMLSLQSVLFNQHVESLAYSDFQALLHAGKVKEVLIRDDSLSGTVDLRGAEAVLPAQTAKSLPKDNLANHEFITARVPDPNLVGELQAAHARFSGQVENRWLSTLLGLVAPAVVFFFIWGLLMRRPSNSLLRIATCYALQCHG